ERLLERDAGFVASRRAVELEEQQLVDGELEQAPLGVARLPLHGIPERRVADVLEQQQAARRGIGVELGNGDTEAGEEVVHVDVRQLAQRLAEHRELVRRYRDAAVG